MTSKRSIINGKGKQISNLLLTILLCTRMGGTSLRGVSQRKSKYCVVNRKAQDRKITRGESGKRKDPQSRSGRVFFLNIYLVYFLL